MESAASVDASDSAKSPHIDDDQRVYLVPYKYSLTPSLPLRSAPLRSARWWRDSQDSNSTEIDSDKRKGALYLVTQASSYSGPLKLINTMFNSDLIFNLRREEDAGQSVDSEDPGVSGQEYALVSGDMWLQALKRHSGRAMKRVGSFSAGGVDMKDVYPLQIRLVLSREASVFGIKIIKKDNAVELFKRACRIFNVETELLRIWDFSGRINMLSSSAKSDFQRQSDQEILLELQIYGLSDSIKCKEENKDESSVSHSNPGCSSSGSSAMMNGSSNTYRFPRTNSSTFSDSFVESGSLGLTGLSNLGNTCFMNSALQCLAHTPKLVDYFLGDYTQEINNDNPLGMNGEIALAFGDLIWKLWAPGASPVAPRPFKSKLARFAPQFSGFNQHDSQELLAFLLDGLHEDLNRVKCKPYFEAKDGEGRPDEEVADEYWQNHLARNDSIIVDVCQGQYRSTLICPECKKVSITFDPFMYLTLPLPSTTMRSMTLTVMHMDGKALPCPVTVSVPKFGKCEDLNRAVTTACSLRDDEMLLIAEVYNHRILRLLEDPADLLSLIRDDDRLVAYRLPKHTEKSTLVVFWHQQWEEQYMFGKPSSSWKSFGIPMLARIYEDFSGSDIYNLYLQLLKPFSMPSESDSDNQAVSLSNLVEGTTEPETNVNDKLPNGDAMDAPRNIDFEFLLADEKGVVKDTKILMDKPIPLDEDSPGRLYIAARWPEKKLELYDTVILSRQSEIFKSGFLAKRPQESISLNKCLEAFLKEEPLGPEDMWYCPCCKEHRQATKKLDLWRLPEILVIHLKRFSYSRYTKNKLESYVDFPIDDLNLSDYISNKNYDSTCRYVLYAISNHYGGLGSGHYTAFVHHGGGQWYDFDDSRVSPISKEKIKTSAAYLLFYRRIADS